MFAAFAAATGCGLLGRTVERPKVEVQQVALTDVGWSGARGTLDLTIINPNAVGLPLTAIEWQLAVHGDRAVTGRIDLRQEIPAKGSAPVRAELTIATADAARVAPHLLRGARDYQLGARLIFATPLGELSVDVTHQGSL
jgi:hypothetical protein